MKRLLRISVVLAIAVLVLAFLRFPTASPPAHAAFPGTNGRIAFASNRTGNSQIFSMNSDGTGQTNLSNTTSNDGDPEWSPDATKIAFDSNRAGNDQIFVMNADGSGVTQLTNVDTNFQPDWSPDGTKIVFVSDRSQPGDCNSVGHCEIYTMNADGSNVTRLTFTSSPILNVNPTWSPDGTKIAFVRGTPFGAHDIWVMNADGSNQTQLTNFGTAFNGIVADLDWSPDGTKIVFERTGGGAFGSIWVMNADGSNQTNLSNMPAFENDFPAWSPDGTKITFASNRDTASQDQIYTMNADGSGVTRLTSDLANDSLPDWGSAVAVCHEDDGNGDMQGNNGGVANLKLDQDQCEDQTDNDQDQTIDKADNIQFNDPGANVNFVSGSINSITFNGPAHSVTITGTGTNAGHVVSFTVIAVSTMLTPPGFFSISLSDGYVNSGNLLSGVIEVS